MLTALMAAMARSLQVRRLDRHLGILSPTHHAIQIATDVNLFALETSGGTSRRPAIRSSTQPRPT